MSQLAAGILLFFGTGCNWGRLFLALLLRDHRIHPLGTTSSVGIVCPDGYTVLQHSTLQPWTPPSLSLEIPSRCHQRVPAPPRALLGPAGAASTQTRAVLAEHPCTTACKTFHFSPLTPSAPLWLCSVAFAAGESGQRGFLLDLNGLEMLHPVWKRTSGFVPSHGGEQQGILSHHLCS